MDRLVEFIYKGGRVELITSVELDETALRSFVAGYSLQSEDILVSLQKKLQEYIENSARQTVDEELRLDVLANLIAAGRMTIKVAATPNGIYHEKLGIFTDERQDSVAFFGSANETLNAFYNNYETLTIGSSWGKASEIVEEYRVHFCRLWANEEPGVHVVDFPKALKDKIITVYKKSSSLENAIQKLVQLRHSPPLTAHARRTLHDYQQEAVDAFVANNYRHLFEMATGTGKTFTAVKAIEQMTLNLNYLNIIVLVPLVDLQRQWEKAIENDLEVSHRVFKFGGCGHDTPLQFRLSTKTASTTQKKFASIAICVYDTFFASAYRQLSVLKGNVLLVVDEVHNLTLANVKVLHSISQYRLGLSATPKRYSKSETESILELFLNSQQVPYRYTLEKAIANGYLSRYKYYPLEVELTQYEVEVYEAQSKRIATLFNIYKNDPNAYNRKQIENALMVRSSLVKKAANKISLLERMVSSNDYDFHNSVVFCGPGKLFRDGAPTSDRIVDLVTRTIGRNSHRHYFPVKYTSGEADRPARLDGFKHGLTDTLIAVKCFDEGLDVPALDKIYIMASDSSLRQTIQRRGRVLRVSKDTGKSIAYIYDMVAGERLCGQFIPLKTELPRVYEYSRLSENPESSISILAEYVPSNDNDIFDELENYD